MNRIRQEKESRLSIENELLLDGVTKFEYIFLGRIEDCVIETVPSLGDFRTYVTGFLFSGSTKKLIDNGAFIF